MEEFKEVPWKSILEQVPLTDLIKLRTVNQQWRRLVDLVLSEKRELALYIECSPDLPFCWHHNDQRMNPHNSLPSKTGIYGSQWFSRQFRDITRLMMIVPTFHQSFIVDKHFLDHNEIKPELPNLSSFIGEFEKLLHLQIVVFKTNADVYDCRISSKTLQTLHIVGGDSCDVQTPFCENLIEFSTPYSFHNIHTDSSFTGKLKYLSCWSLCFERAPDCFPSLEVLVLERQQKPIHLDDFPRLEKLHFNVVEDWSRVFLVVFKAKDRNRRSLKIVLSGVHFSFEREHFDNEPSYWKAIRSLYDQLMALEQRTNYTPTISSFLVDFWRKLRYGPYFSPFPATTIDVELLRFYVRCKANFESNRIKRVLLYSDALGQTLVALRSEDPSLYESLARCVDKILFSERITNRESLYNLKDFFEWISTVYLIEFDQALLDLLPTIVPRLKYLDVSPVYNQSYVPIDLKFLSKLTSLYSCYIEAKICADLNDLRAFLRNCQYVARADFETFSFDKSWSIRGLVEAGWALYESDSNGGQLQKEFPDKEALLDYCESIPDFLQSKEPSMLSTSLNKLQHVYRTLGRHFLGMN